MNLLKATTYIAALFLFWGCFDSTGPDKKPPGDLEGTITKDITLDAKIEYTIEGMVYVDKGVTLTIPEGTVIKANGKSALVIRPGATIEAVGTKEKPIVFTSANPNPESGDWAGIVIFGEAPVSTADNTQKFEADEGETFGGTKKASNSGILKYVRIEYAGYTVGPDKELNGLTLGGVGTGTQISYVQIHAGKDDAIEFFGGTVEVDHIVVTDYQDDGFDIDEGFVGKLSFGLNIQGDESDRCIEAGSKAVNKDLLTAPTFSNITMWCNSTNQALHLKDNVSGTYEKFVVVSDSASELIKAEGDVTLAKLADGSTVFSDFFYAGNFQNSVIDVSGDETIDMNELTSNFTQVSNALNSNWSAKNAAIKDAGAGAIVGNDLWYEDWTMEGTITGKDENPAEIVVLSGTISDDMTLEAGVQYELNGFVYVDGATLSIPAGTMFKSAGKSALIVNSNAKLEAKGTKESPIVFTSKASSPEAGDWAGIVLFGKAPVSTADHTQSFEANEADKFGGDTEEHNSGTLEYVRIEYAGYVVATDKELNGLTLGGVGSGTKISYVQIHEGKDDAIEFFGGAAEVDHIVVTSYHDDGFDVDEGFSGSISYGINIQGEGSDRCIEAGSKAVDPDMITAPTFSNITMWCNSTNQALHLKDNVSGTYEKFVVISDSASELIKAEGDVTIGKLKDSSTVFSDFFYSGSFVNAVLDFGADSIQSTLDRVSPNFVQVANPLNDDLSAKDSKVKDAEAGAIVGSDLWYEDWTKEGTITSKSGSTGDVVVLTGTINSDMELDADIQYELNGFVYVEDATLTIPAGTVFKSSGKSALIITTTGKLMAEGTADKPIIMTSKAANPEAGDWAGVVVFGQAPVSTADKTQSFEANESDKFGGNVADHNSGVIKYVIIEYAGYVVATDKELNGLTLGGVGTGTEVSYVQIHEGKDDAVEFFGGSVNVDHIIVTSYHDDGFDVDEGYTGTINYGINIQGEGSDRAIEAGSKAVDPNRITAPTFNNITIWANSTNQALHLKDNVAGTYNKFVVVSDSATEIIKAEGSVTLDAIKSGDLKLSKFYYSGVAVNSLISAAGDSAAEAALSAGITRTMNPLNADLSPAAAEVISDSAGAIVGDDLWYEGWSVDGTLDLGNEPTPENVVLSGTIDADMELSNLLTYELDGFVYVDGATLTIPAGAYIASSGKSALIVNPGAKIMAMGNAANPIVFTSKEENPETGDWAGVVILGNAPVSTADSTQAFEANATDIFGGKVSNDNSGVLKYARIEYAGYVVATDKELNGLTLGGVGSQTEISHVQIHEGKDDAIEFFGGSVNVDHIVVTAYHDDGFDVDEGFNGSVSFGLNVQGAESDKAIEAGDKAVNQEQITAPSFSNITIVSNGVNDVIHFKNNVSGNYDKFVILTEGAPSLIKLEGDVSIASVNSDETVVTNCFYTGDPVIVTNTGDASAETKLNAACSDVDSPLNADYSPAASAVSDAEAGAIVDELWYMGWVKAGTI